MKLLLDTHTFIWWDSEPQRLSQKVLNMCQDPENVLLASVASLWEMQIKLQLGKLKLNKPLTELVSGQQAINNIDILDVKLEHVLALAKLPSHHKLIIKIPSIDCLSPKRILKKPFWSAKIEFLQNMRSK